MPVAISGTRQLATRALWGAVALLLVALLAVPASAGAAEATGNTTLVLSKGQAKKLGKRGVKVRGGGKAITQGRSIRLQVAGGEIGSGGAWLSYRSTLLFSAATKSGKKRIVKLTALRTQLGASSAIVGKLNGKGKLRPLFDIKPQPGTLALDGLRGTASLPGSRLVWRGAAAKAIGKRLGVKLIRGALGSVRTSAVATGTDVPVSGPVSNEPPQLARPASAVDVKAATVTWHVRSSWINYVATGNGTTALEGAVPGPAVAEDKHPCLDDAGGDTEPRVYDFTFPFANGWYDPVSGSAALYTSGAIHFAFKGHGINLTMRNPEIELNGASSRAIFRLKGTDSTSYPDARAAVLNLKLTESLSESPAGTFSFANPFRGTLTSDGLTVFGGFYSPPNDGFGCFSTSFSTS